MTTTTETEIGAGLRTSTTTIPLEHLAVRASINGAQARVSLRQRYRNRETQPVEAVYVFPLDERAAVCGFNAVVNGVRYDGVVKAREEAFATYDDAMAEGHGAFLLDEERPDIFAASVGSILPGSVVELELTYVTELTFEGDAVRFTLPTTVAPRYAPAEDRVGVGRPDGDALNPPHVEKVPYGLTFEATIATAGQVRRIESPSHPVAVELGPDTATVTLAQQNATLDRDVILLIDLADAGRPSIVLERDDQGHVAAALTLRPAFSTERAPADVVFLVDRSGSMQGSSIEQVRNALQLCLRSLVAGSSFDIVGFGSSFTSLFDGRKPYDESSLKAASEHIDSMKASLGGTEILPALEFVLAKGGRPERPLQVVILTDGQVTNTDAVLDLVRRHSDRVRVFTFGIGRAASHHLVNGLARAGRGAAEFVHPGERLEAKIMRQFTRMLSPTLTDVRLEWSGLRSTPVPATLPPVFGNEPVRAYAWIDEIAPGTVTLHANSPHGPLSWSLEIDPGAVTAGRVVGTLTARARIRELEESGEWHPERGSRQRERKDERVASAIVNLASQYGLASRETSWVVVEKRDVPTTETSVLRRVPIAIASGWGGGRLGREGLVLGQPIGRALSGLDFSALLGTDTGEIPKHVLEAALRRGGHSLEREAGPPSTSWLRKMFKRPSQKSTRPLDRLIALQRADGSWELNEALVTACGFQPILVTLLRSTLPAGSSDEATRAIATAFALTFLRRHASADEPEWALLAQKAERWLQTVSVAPTDAGSWQEAAKGVMDMVG